MTVPSTVEVLPGDDAACRRAACRCARRRRGCGPRARPGLHVHRPTDSGVSLARSSTVSPSTSSTLRTCRDGGVTGSPSTTSRRAPSASATVTGAPAAVCAGTPGTMSTQTGSVRSWSRVVAPVAGSTRSARSAVWSRGWTTTSRPWSSQTTSARYSSVQRIGVRRPSKVMIFGADQRVRRARRRVGDDRRAPGRGARDRRCASAAPGCRRRARRPARRPRATTSSRASAPSPRPRRSRRARSSPRGRPVRRGCSSFPPGEVVDVQRAAADVGDVPTVRVRPRVDHAAGRVDPPRRRAAREVDDVQAARSSANATVLVARSVA